MSATEHRKAKMPICLVSIPTIDIKGVHHAVIGDESWSTSDSGIRWTER